GVLVSARAHLVTVGCVRFAVRGCPVHGDRVDTRPGDGWAGLLVLTGRVARDVRVVVERGEAHRGVARAAPAAVVVATAVAVPVVVARRGGGRRGRRGGGDDRCADRVTVAGRCG